MIGLIGKKIGMSRIFTEGGETIPVTVVECLPNRVIQIKTEEKDGYSALQLSTGVRRPIRVNRAMQGHYAKAEVSPGRTLREFRVSANEVAKYQVGDTLEVALFSPEQKIDVSGKTIGRGFTGTMKRHHFAGGRASHGNSKAHRKPGSIGQNQDPSRVFPGKKMSGHSGDAQRVQQNLTVVRVDAERNLLLIKGAIPGSRGQDLVIRPAIKTKPN